MHTFIRAYDPDRDWARIRDFLVETFALYGRPFNWLIDRWNFCRYFVLPIHTYYNVRLFGVPTQPRPSFRDELPAWEAAIGIWENDAGEIVGVVHTENEEAGEALVQIHPGYHALYDEMVTYIEEHLADRVGDTGYVKLYANEGTELEEVARARGYRKLPFRRTFLEYRIGRMPPPELPEGWAVRSVADEDDVEARRLVRSLAFGANYGPTDWTPASALREMQRAPDYRPDLDLFVVAPSGEYVAFCTMWLDGRNGYANLEPVGTHPEYQRRGLGRAVLMEAFRRAAAYGATRSYMDSGLEFYRRVGFVETPYAFSPWIKHFRL